MEGDGDAGRKKLAASQIKQEERKKEDRKKKARKRGSRAEEKREICVCVCICLHLFLYTCLKSCMDWINHFQAYSPPFPLLLFI